MCTLEKRGKVFHLILTGPDEQHRLNPTTIDSIHSALAQIRSDSTPGSALVTSSDGRFDLGLPLPGYFMALLRSKIVNPIWRREVTMRGERVSADRAVEMGIVDSAHGDAGETIEAALRLGEELSTRGWDGHVYASMRVQSLPGVCGAVGLGLGGGGKVEREETAVARL